MERARLIRAVGISMTENDRPCTEHVDKVEAKDSGKKPYRKPEFRYERVFETLALVCGKLNGGGPQCRFVRKRS